MAIHKNVKKKKLEQRICFSLFAVFFFFLCIIIIGGAQGLKEAGAGEGLISSLKSVIKKK